MQSQQLKTSSIATDAVRGTYVLHNTLPLLQIFQTADATCTVCSWYTTTRSVVDNGLRVVHETKGTAYEWLRYAISNGSVRNRTQGDPQSVRSSAGCYGGRRNGGLWDFRRYRRKLQTLGSMWAVSQRGHLISQLQQWLSKNTIASQFYATAAGSQKRTDHCRNAEIQQKKRAQLHFLLVLNPPMKTHTKGVAMPSRESRLPCQPTHQAVATLTLVVFNISTTSYIRECVSLSFGNVPVVTWAARACECTAWLRSLCCQAYTDSINTTALLKTINV